MGHEGALALHNPPALLRCSTLMTEMSTRASSEADELREALEVAAKESPQQLPIIQQLFGLLVVLGGGLKRPISSATPGTVVAVCVMAVVDIWHSL